MVSKCKNCNLCVGRVYRGVGRGGCRNHWKFLATLAKCARFAISLQIMSYDQLGLKQGSDWEEGGGGE